MEHFDVLVVGAGISGIGAAYHLQDQCPGRTYAIFEGRANLGGTWDLFRYPGIRSDSDMYTLGFAFKPWTEAKAIADGPSILNYLAETAQEFGIDKHIRFQHRVTEASWDSAASRWTLRYTRGPDAAPATATCNFLYMCTGYYNYAKGHQPEFPGAADFKGQILHPQFWPTDLDYAGKKVVVIGSGATAVTLVPSMADTAAHVTMLQRSPTYVVSRPAEDAGAQWLRKWLPGQLAYDVVRFRNIAFQRFFYNAAIKNPEKTRETMLNMVRAELGPDFDVETHFTPTYNPWTQRVCLVPDADLFKALKAGTASVVTDHIDRFTETGILLKSGKTLEADIIVTATGLEMQALSGVHVTVDDAVIDFGKCFSYKGMMYSDVPNLASVFGYVNASWTLRADLTSEYVCRLLNHMRRTGTTECRPVNTDPGLKALPFLDFGSGYVTRAMERMPKQGDRAPWTVPQNYVRDLMSLRYDKVTDGVMSFRKARPVGPAAAAPTSRVPEPADA
jgi:cation diffusion facilitator CzcD-associated flavoprotein CzcO